MSILADQWYTRLWRMFESPASETSTRHPFLVRMSALYCNPLLNGGFRELYVSSDSVFAALSQHERRFESSLSARVAHTKIYRPEYEE